MSVSKAGITEGLLNGMPRGAAECISNSELSTIEVKSVQGKPVEYSPQVITVGEKQLLGDDAFPLHIETPVRLPIPTFFSKEKEGDTNELMVSIPLLKEYKLIQKENPVFLKESFTMYTNFSEINLPKAVRKRKRKRKRAEVPITREKCRLVENAARRLSLSRAAFINKCIDDNLTQQAEAVEAVKDTKIDNPKKEIKRLKSKLVELEEKVEYYERVEIVLEKEQRANKRLENELAREQKARKRLETVLKTLSGGSKNKFLGLDSQSRLNGDNLHTCLQVLSSNMPVSTTGAGYKYTSTDVNLSSCRSSTSIRKLCKKIDSANALDRPIERLGEYLDIIKNKSFSELSAQTKGGVHWNLSLVFQELYGFRFSRALDSDSLENKLDELRKALEYSELALSNMQKAKNAYKKNEDISVCQEKHTELNEVKEAIQKWINNLETINLDLIQLTQSTYKKEDS